MSQTKEERVEYWRKRIKDKIRSVIGQMNLDFDPIEEDLQHIGFENRGIIKAMTNVTAAFDGLLKAIDEAKVKTKS